MGLPKVTVNEMNGRNAENARCTLSSIARIMSSSMFENASESLRNRTWCKGEANSSNFLEHNAIR